jgi:hypothetical protein
LTANTAISSSPRFELPIWKDDPTALCCLTTAAVGAKPAAVVQALSLQLQQVSRKAEMLVYVQKHPGTQQLLTCGVSP